MRYLFIILVLAHASDAPAYRSLTDSEAGYDQAAYDECVDSVVDRTCE